MINVMSLPIGARIRLKEGATVTVVENPQDGMWIVVRRAESTEDEMVHADQVAGLA